MSLLYLEKWKKRAEKEIWKRVAFACRYGRAGLETALTISTYDLNRFNEAVDALMTEESKQIEEASKP